MNENEIEKVSIVANGRGLELQTFDKMKMFAETVRVSGMAPKCFDTSSKILVAIQMGAELGLSAMKSLQSIAVINGRPSIWGDAALGMVRASGLCEYVKEWIEGQKEGMVAHCECKRKGEKEPIARTFSVSDAITAGLWNKAGTWKAYPKRMLQYRARGFALRDAFADVLCGFHLTEELTDIPEPEYEPTTPRRDERKPVENITDKLDSLTVCVQKFFSLCENRIKDDALPRYFAEYTAYTFGGSGGDFRQPDGSLDPDKYEGDMVEQMNTELDKNGLPEAVAKLLPITTKEAEQTAEEKFGTYTNNFKCLNCNKEFPSKTDNGLCPECLSDKVTEVPDGE